MTEGTIELEEDVEGGLRWYVVVAYVVAIVIGFAAALWAFVDWVAACDDKGFASAGDSTRSALCEGAGGAAVLLVPAAWILGLALATLALVRWEGGLRGTLALGLLLLAPTLLPVAVHVGFERTSTTCSADDLRAYRAWADEGSTGAPPSDCRIF